MSPDEIAPVAVVFDPHVANAILALALAFIAAIVAWALGLPNQRRRWW